MKLTTLPPQSNRTLSPRETLPTMYDLPSEHIGEPALPDEFHGLQGQFLFQTFQPKNYYPNRLFSAVDLYLYYDANHPKWYKRPDWFGVVDVSRLYEAKDSRLSYVIWQEQVTPLIVVELLSPGTEKEDLGQTQNEKGKPPTKWYVYEQILGVPYYVVFSRYTNKMQAFCLTGSGYQPAPLTDGRLVIPTVELSLGLWEGNYQGIHRLWLRWMTASGELIPLASEALSAAEERANNAEVRAEKLAAKLRELGVDLDE